MKKPLPPVLRAALYRRAVACAWLTVCKRQRRYPNLTLDALESAIAAELEGFYLSQALDGLDYGPAELAALAEDVTKEDVQAIAKSIECDLIYFLKGSGEEDGSDDETA